MMQRDYVIQLRPDCDVKRGQFEGRVEHIYSGRSIHFGSVEDLLAFIARSIELDAAPVEDERATGQNLTLL
jgi:hypothetical protein